MVVAFMGVTSSRDVAVWRTLSTELNPVQPFSCPPTRPAVDTLCDISTDALLP
jgi:hypothetical protein